MEHVRGRVPGAFRGDGGPALSPDATATAAAPPRRLVVLGASNVTRGLPCLIQLAREAWRDPLEVFGAIGFGRSYGMTSRVLARTLPSIVDCALWRELAAHPPVPTRALVTDVGNDIGYGAPVDEIRGWVEDCVSRLLSLDAEVVMTDLPLSSLERLSSPRYVLFRSVFFPSCRLSLPDVLERASELARGLREIAARRGVRFESADAAWYGLDPIHVRWTHMRRAWRRTLLAPSEGPLVPVPRLSPLRLWAAPPERQHIFGIERRRRQPTVAASGGGSSLWFY